MLSFIFLNYMATASALPPSSAPSPRLPSVLRAAELHEDLQVLRDVLALHPGRLRYNTAAELDAHLAALAKDLDHDQGTGAAFLAIGRFLATLRCGHSFLNPANQGATVRAELLDRAPRVPFSFAWRERRMVVLAPAPGPTAALFPRGAEVLAINDRPAATILAGLLPLARADGGNDDKRLALLGVRPDAEPDGAFDVFFPLVFPPPAGSWRFRVRPPGEPERTVTAAPLTRAERNPAPPLAPPGDLDRPSWSLTYPKGEPFALLTMPSWVTYKSKWDWRGFVHQTFVALSQRGAPALVIDLRGNEGGTSVGDVILAHLLPRSAPRRTFERYTAYQHIPPALRPVLDTWDRSFDDWGKDATSAPERPGFFRLADDPGEHEITPAAPRFKGRVFVLIGADNSSATFEFASQIRRHRLGLLVGQPTGGNQRGINGGAFYFVRLPRSRIEFDLPLIAQFPPASAPLPPDGGLAPDLLVPRTVAAVASGEDLELAAVRRALAGATREARSPDHPARSAQPTGR